MSKNSIRPSLEFYLSCSVVFVFFIFMFPLLLFACYLRSRTASDGGFTWHVMNCEGLEEGVLRPSSRVHCPSFARVPFLSPAFTVRNSYRAKN